jgi:predicted DNA binding protein
MLMGIRLVAEYYDIKSGKVIESRVLREDKIKRPTTLKEFGYLHSEQIQLLQGIQDFKLLYETKLINEEVLCPNCHRKTSARGTRKSNFHAVFTDHKISIQRRRCPCGWSSPDSVEGIYGSSMHPDLVEKQVIQGAENSYRQASRQLNAESKNHRRINNDDRIRRTIADIASILEEDKLKVCKTAAEAKATKELVVVVDGGHLKSKAVDSHSFEAMIATVYRPENIRCIDKNHNEITQKTSVASALSDRQKTIKRMVLNACRKEGSNARITHLTCLTDGASNCWSITHSLKGYCKTLENVLDWFHITKRFTMINNHVDKEFKERLEKVKWFLWHGDVNNALSRLAQVQSDVQDEKLFADLKDLHTYIKRNRGYIVNYQERQAAHLPFTSTLAESSVNALINARQKDNKKMQWTREGAHHVLQIRTSRFSKTWEQDWQKAQEKMYLKAA